jgi:hypothetical protein
MERDLMSETLSFGIPKKLLKSKESVIWRALPQQSGTSNN